AGLAGHFPPGLEFLPFRREPIDGLAGPGVAADDVATEAPQVAVLGRREIKRIPTMRHVGPRPRPKLLQSPDRRASIHSEALTDTTAPAGPSLELQSPRSTNARSGGRRLRLARGSEPAPPRAANSRPSPAFRNGRVAERRRPPRAGKAAPADSSGRGHA